MCGMQKVMVLFVISNVQSGWMVDQLHSSVFGGDLGVECTLVHITPNHLMVWCERGREREHLHLPTMQSAQP